jgi:hypothetical protein
MASSKAASASPRETLGFRHRCVLNAESSFLNPPSRRTTFSTGTSQLLNWISARYSPPMVW